MRAPVGIVIQARVGSTRLPGKALADVAGMPLLAHCLTRLIAAGSGRVVLATTTAVEDDALVAVARRYGVGVYRGSSDDVLGRYVGAARSFGFGVVVRATADNPAVDLAAPGRLVAALERELADYVWEEGMPYGGAVEAFTTAALERAAAVAVTAEDREHVTPYLRRHPERFRVLRLDAPAPIRRPDVRVTVDTAADLFRVNRLFLSTGRPQPSLAEIIAASDDLAQDCAA